MLSFKGLRLKLKALKGREKLRSKRGSFVEATMVLPLSILMIIALINLMIGFYQGFYTQVENRQEDIKEMYRIREVSIIRAYDKLIR